MLRLYQAGGGSSEIILDGAVPPELSRSAKERAARLLVRRGITQAANILRNSAFELWNGHNGFGDDFYVLHAQLPLAKYVELADAADDRLVSRHFQQIAGTLAEVDAAVRFIAVTLDEAGEPAAVSAPTPTTTSDAIELSLSEVERALAEGRPEVGVDRIHTALHAYLRALADAAGLAPAADAGITALFSLLRQSHPSLHPTGPRAAEITKILRAMAAVVGALDPLRNRASLAHPPEESLLANAEAMLVINAVRTLLHYIESKTVRAAP